MEKMEKKKAVVLTISDRGAAGLREDTAGPAAAALLESRGIGILYRKILPDDFDLIRAALIDASEPETNAALVLTVGGTGFAPRDVTPEATRAVIEREAPGLPEAMRRAGCEITPRGMLSRAVAGIRGRTLIVNLPGSEKGAVESLEAVMEGLLHGLDMLLELKHDCAAGT